MYTVNIYNKISWKQTRYRIFKDSHDGLLPHSICKNDWRIF